MVKTSPEQADSDRSFSPASPRVFLEGNRYGENFSSPTSPDFHAHKAAGALLFLSNSWASLKPRKKVSHCLGTQKLPLLASGVLIPSSQQIQEAARPEYPAVPFSERNYHTKATLFNNAATIPSRKRGVPPKKRARTCGADFMPVFAIQTR